VTRSSTPFGILKRSLAKTIPWIVTIIALYVALHDVDWSLLVEHLGEASFSWLLVGFGLTCCSYLMRSRRWQFLFPTRVMNFSYAARVLILGFFMNNVLPARAGEFVRAHFGAQVIGKDKVVGNRTLVLATIASERLADGLMLSLLFVIFALGVGGETLSKNLLYVATLFGVASLGVILVLIFRKRILKLAEVVSKRVGNKAAEFALVRFEIFLHGLSPLCELRKLPIISLWTIAIWLIELCVYVAVTHAFDARLPLAACVLFLVTVNFSSLIPAAPGGIGVIEAITSTVLMSLGVTKEHALTMVFVQHLSQILVVGIPGAAIMITWRRKIAALHGKISDPDPGSAAVSQG